MRVADFFRAVVRFRVLDYVVCLIIGLGGWLIGRTVRPHCRTFTWTDPRISYPHAANPAFPTWTLVPITIVPGVLCVLCEALLVYLSFAHNYAAHVESGRGREPRLATRAARAASPTGNPSAAARAQARYMDDQEPGDCTAAVAVSADGEDREETLAEAQGEKVKDLLLVHNLEQHPWRFFFLRAHYWILTQALSVTFAMLIVDCGKVYAGRLRPDFLARLRSAGFSPSSVLSPEQWCEQARGGRLSFPSGHSALSFAGVVPLIVYLQNALRCFGGTPCAASAPAGQHSALPPTPSAPSSPTSAASPQSSTSGCARRQRAQAALPNTFPTPPPPPHAQVPNTETRALVCACVSGFAGAPYTRFTIGLLPLILPIAVALSRTTDYRHHFDDIVAGSFIGTVTALLAVVLNFRSGVPHGGLVPRYP